MMESVLPHNSKRLREEDSTVIPLKKLSYENKFYKSENISNESSNDDKLNFKTTDSCNSTNLSIYQKEDQTYRYCDEESVASMSFSLCSEDLSGSFHSDVSTYNVHKKKKKKHMMTVEENYTKPIRPNYFVSIQVSNPLIHKNAVEFQNKLLKGDDRLASALIDVATFHITLLVIHISNEEELNRACSALDHCGASLMKNLSNSPLFLAFEGLSHFSHQTLYSKLIEDDHYHRLLLIANEIRRIFIQHQIMVTGKEELVPHLTIAKLSRASKVKGKPRLRKIEQSLYEEYLNLEFGIQVVQSLQLLSMNKPKSKKRYYYCAREVSFDTNFMEDMDHSDCCFPRRPIGISKSDSQKRSFSTTSSKNSFYLSNDVVVKALIGGAVVLSFAFIVSKLLKK